MNKDELIGRIAQNSTLTKSQIRQVVEDTFSYIAEALAEGDKFKMSGFGAFSVRKRAARKGSNPRTGEKIFIEEKNAPVFSPGKKLVEMVNTQKS
ncbi:MAG: HU family DNA-binding protein [Firmicutes bacterium]|nr:HU family DNA-binding protein [Bacillota bacterium]